MSLTIQGSNIVWQGQSLITTEGLSYALSENTSSNNLELSLETSARISGDASLSISISNLIGTTTPSALDTLAELASALSNDPNFVFNLSTSLSTETSARISSDVSLSSGLSSEISARISGDVSLSSGLSSEISARISGDTITNIYLNDLSNNYVPSSTNINISLNSNTTTLVTNNLPICAYKQLTSLPYIPSKIGVGNPAGSAAVRALVFDTNNNLYVGGDFTTAGGVTVNYVAKWDGSSWSALGTGVGNTVRALACDASNNLYVGGDFTTVNAGVLTVNYVAKWNGSSWSALGTGVNGVVGALVCDASNNLYVGGLFTTAGGVTVNRVAKWNISGSSWSALGSSPNEGVNNVVNALACDASNNLYVGGNFTTVNAGGVPVNYVAKWNGSSWSALGSGVNAGVSFTVNALACDASNNLYVGGSFETAGGVLTVNRVAKWNGSSWSALGSSPNVGVNNIVYSLACDASNNLYVGGFFTTAGVVSANRVAKWDGSSWSALGSGVTNSVFALVRDASNNLYVGGNFATNLNNNGTITLNNIAKIIQNQYTTQTVNLYVNSSYVYTAKIGQTVEVKINTTGTPYVWPANYYDV